MKRSFTGKELIKIFSELNKTQRFITNSINQILSNTSLKNATISELLLLYEMHEKKKDLTPQEIAKSGAYLSQHLILHLKNLERQKVLDIKTQTGNVKDMKIFLHNDKYSEMIHELEKNLEKDDDKFLKEIKGNLETLGKEIAKFSEIKQI